MSCADPTCILNDFVQLEDSVIDAYHFDICDGVFAPTFLLNFSVIEKLRPSSSKRFDVHLYCHYPSKYLEEIKKSGADIVTVQIETGGENYLETVNLIQDLGMEAGIGILPTSQIPENFEQAINMTNYFVVNTVGPAYAGQPFNPHGLENLRILRKISNQLGKEIEIGVDGGVSIERIPQFLSAGANHFICGTSSLFMADNELIRHAQEFRTALELALKE